MTIKFDALGDAEIRRIAQLVEILEKSGFDHLTLEIDDFRLTVGTGAGPVSAGPAVQPQVVASPVANPGASTASAPATISQGVHAAAPAPEAGSIEVKAPSMGQFYSRPDPASPPFVTLGSKVEASSTVGLVEVMKLFNAIAAGVEGEVVQICVEDTAVVEYGQVLMRVRPT
jgi:acetyl-CoA carboxylase biotin carboxyl carrier protein